MNPVSYELTQEDINALRAYIQSEPGKKFILKLVDQEMTLLAQAYNSKASLELQGQIVNRVSGIYWVRTLIDDLTKITPKTKYKKK